MAEQSPHAASCHIHLNSAKREQTIQGTIGDIGDDGERGLVEFKFWRVAHCRGCVVVGPKDREGTETELLLQQKQARKAQKLLEGKMIAGTDSGTSLKRHSVIRASFSRSLRRSRPGEGGWPPRGDAQAQGPLCGSCSRGRARLGPVDRPPHVPV